MNCYGHLNFSRVSVVQFRASQSIMGLNHTPESKVMLVWICRELSCSYSSVTIYYEPELDIRVKSYDHLNFLRAFVVHFLASRYIMSVTHAPKLKFMVVGICWELPCSILSVSIYYAPKSDIWMKSYDHLNFSSASAIQFHVSPYIMGLNQTPESKVMAFESAESFCVHIRASRYIISLKRTSRVKSYNHLNFLRASLFIFERLDKLWVSHMPPSQNLWPLEFVERFLVQFLVSQYIMRLNHTSEWKVMIIWISLELSLFIF